jgi:hypothetical protein
MVVFCQIGSALTGFVAAILWFRSAASPAPQATYDEIDRLRSFLDAASRLNRWAAGVTALSMLMSAGATLLSVATGK